MPALWKVTPEPWKQDLFCFSPHCTSEFSFLVCENASFQNCSVRKSVLEFNDCVSDKKVIAACIFSFAETSAPTVQAHHQQFDSLKIYSRKYIPCHQTNFFHTSQANCCQCWTLHLEFLPELASELSGSYIVIFQGGLLRWKFRNYWCIFPLWNFDDRRTNNQPCVVFHKVSIFVLLFAIEKKQQIIAHRVKWKPCLQQFLLEVPLCLVPFVPDSLWN